MKKLISMTDFVLEQNQKWYNVRYSAILNYANFLKQPLELWMFFPCDEYGNLLKEPKRWNDYLEFPESFDGNKEWYDLYEYQQAKERCLFEFNPYFLSFNKSDMEGCTIEDLLSDDIEYTLTQTTTK